MISPDITISNHRLRWAVDGMRFTAPLHTWQENCWPKHKTNRRKFYICADGPHTHARAPQQRGRWSDDENEMKVKVKWKLLNQDAKRGTQKKRERANTNTTHLARNGKTLERQGKRTAEADGHGTRPAEEGEDGSAWTNLTRRNLSLPRHAQDPTYLKGGERRNTWERGPMGDKLMKWCIHTYHAGYPD